MSLRSPLTCNHSVDEWAKGRIKWAERNSHWIRRQSVCVCVTQMSWERHTYRGGQKEVALLFFSLLLVSFLCNTNSACYATAKSKQKQVSRRDIHQTCVNRTRVKESVYVLTVCVCILTLCLIYSPFSSAMVSSCFFPRLLLSPNSLLSLCSTTLPS